MNQTSKTSFGAQLKMVQTWKYLPKNGSEVVESMLSLSKSSDNLNYNLPNKLRINAFEETPLNLIQSNLPKDKSRWQLQQMVKKSSKGTTKVYNGSLQCLLQWSLFDY